MKLPLTNFPFISAVNGAYKPICIINTYEKRARNDEYFQLKIYEKRKSVGQKICDFCESVNFLTKHHDLKNTLLEKNFFTLIRNKQSTSKSINL